MSRYSTPTLDHFDHPRNGGSFDQDVPRVATGVVREPLRGEIVQFQILVCPPGLIQDSRFRVLGGPITIAAASLATEWVKGKSLDEAAAIDCASLARHLELAALDIASAASVGAAIKAAIADHRRKIDGPDSHTGSG